MKCLLYYNTVNFNMLYAHMHLSKWFLMGYIFCNFGPIIILRAQVNIV